MTLACLYFNNLMLHCKSSEKERKCCEYVVVNNSHGKGQLIPLFIFLLVIRIGSLFCPWLTSVKKTDVEKVPLDSLLALFIACYCSRDVDSRATNFQAPRRDDMLTGWRQGLH